MHLDLKILSAKSDQGAGKKIKSTIKHFMSFSGWNEGSSSRVCHSYNPSVFGIWIHVQKDVDETFQGAIL